MPPHSLIVPPIRKYSVDITRLKLQAWCDKAERCHWDVRNKLTDWGVPYSEREELIGWLIGLDFLNEERYAKAFAHDKFTFNRWGTKKIEVHLKAKGVSERNIKDALKEIAVEDARATVVDLIKKKEPQFKGLQLYQKKIKLARFLLSKGFEKDIIWKEIESYYSI